MVPFGLYHEGVDDVLSLIKNTIVIAHVIFKIISFEEKCSQSGLRNIRSNRYGLSYKSTIA